MSSSHGSFEETEIDLHQFQPKLAKHPKHFLPDGTLTILVEQQVFKVYEHFLVQESKKFQTLLAAHRDRVARRSRHPLDSDDEDDDRAALHLDQVSAQEFEALLDFFADGMFDDYSPSLDGWLDLLSVSHTLAFPRVLKRAVRQIDTGDYKTELDPVHKLTLAKKYGVEQWLVPCYEALCQRPGMLSIDEARVLGLDTANYVWTMREEVRETCTRRVRPYSAITSNVWDVQNYDLNTVKSVVQRVLASQAQDVVIEEATSGEHRLLEALEIMAAEAEPQAQINDSFISVPTASPAMQSYPTKYGGFFD